MIPVLEAAPIQQKVRARERELYRDDLPGAYVRLLYGLPEGALVTSRVDQLASQNRVERRSS